MDEERRAHGGLEHAGNSPRRLLLPAYGQWRNLGKRGLVVVEVIPFRGAPTGGALCDSGATPELSLYFAILYRASLHLPLVRRRFSTIIAWPGMVGIADFPAAAGRLPRRGGLMDVTRSCHTTFSILNWQSAMGN